MSLAGGAAGRREVAWWGGRAGNLACMAATVAGVGAAIGAPARRCTALPGIPRRAYCSATRRAASRLSSAVRWRSSRGAPVVEATSSYKLRRSPRAHRSRRLELMLWLRRRLAAPPGSTAKQVLQNMNSSSQAKRHRLRGAVSAKPPGAIQASAVLCCRTCTMNASQKLLLCRGKKGRTNQITGINRNGENLIQGRKAAKHCIQVRIQTSARKRQGLRAHS